MAAVASTSGPPTTLDAGSSQTNNNRNHTVHVRSHPRWCQLRSLSHHACQSSHNNDSFQPCILQHIAKLELNCLSTFVLIETALHELLFFDGIFILCVMDMVEILSQSLARGSEKKFGRSPALECPWIALLHRVHVSAFESDFSKVA